MEELRLKKIQVRNNSILTTADRYEDVSLDMDKKSKILTLNETGKAHKLVQRILNVGPMVRDLKEGDIVFLNPLHYLKRELVEQKDSLAADIPEKHMKEVYGPSYEFPTIVIDGKECLTLFDRDVEYIILEAEGI